jgi:hypothetical protein
MNKSMKRKFAWNARAIVKSPFADLSEAKLMESKFESGEDILIKFKKALIGMGRIKRSTGMYKLDSKYSNHEIKE